MKKRIIITMIAALMTMTPMLANAQSHNAQGQCSNGCAKTLALTDDQAKKMDQIRADGQRKTFQIDLQIKEKKAHLKTLRYADKPDMGAINSTIEEIGRLKTERDKIKEANFQEMRSMLNAEQRAKFDMMSAHGNKKAPKHNGSHHQGQHGKHQQGDHQGQHNDNGQHPNHGQRPPQNNNNNKK